MAPPEAAKCGRAARTTFSGPDKLVAITASQTAGSSPATLPPRCRPALLINTSIPPKTSTADEHAIATLSGEVTSAAMPQALGPSSAAIATLSKLRAIRQTRSPPTIARRAIARPRPREAPVTSQFRGAPATGAPVTDDCVGIALPSLIRSERLRERHAPGPGWSRCGIAPHPLNVIADGPSVSTGEVLAEKAQSGLLPAIIERGIDQVLAWIS